MPTPPASRPAGSKKPKPSFDLGREPLAETKAGWVYRSDAPSVGEPGADPAPVPRTRPATPRTRPAAPAPSGRASALESIVMPFELALIVALAPIRWMFRPRRTR